MVTSRERRREVAAYLHKVGQEYGKLGGKKAAANMKPAQRKARAKKASKGAAEKRTAARLQRERMSGKKR